MTPQEREVMQMALDCIVSNQVPAAAEVKEAIRAALAQPTFALNGIDCSCGRKWRVENGVITASEPETFMAEYKFQTYGAYKADGEVKIGVMPEQEPVAVWELQSDGWDTIADPEWIETLPIGTKLYTAPPQREWQGLTPEDKRIAGIPLYTDQISMSDAFDVIERILKEKNCAPDK